MEEVVCNRDDLMLNPLLVQTSYTVQTSSNESEEGRQYMSNDDSDADSESDKLEIGE